MSKLFIRALCLSALDIVIVLPWRLALPTMEWWMPILLCAMLNVALTGFVDTARKHEDAP